MPQPLRRPNCPKKPIAGGNELAKLGFPLIIEVAFLEESCYKAVPCLVVPVDWALFLEVGGGFLVARWLVRGFFVLALVAIALALIPSEASAKTNVASAIPESAALILVGAGSTLMLARWLHRRFK